jgi:DNA polymerase I-like protein with 3'-5' exonuclease and polymerase domains
MEQKTFDLEFLGTLYRGHYIKETDDAIDIIAALIEKEDILFGIDTETEPKPAYIGSKTAGLSPHLATVRLLQIFDGKNSIILDMKYVEVFPLLVDFLSTKRFVGHNSVFDLQFFKQWGVRNMNIGCTYILTKLIHHAILETDEDTNAKLVTVCREMLGVDLSKQMQVSNWSEPNLTFEQIQYAALDPLVALLVAEKMAPALTKYGITKVYQLYKAAQHPIASMQLNGMCFDIEAHNLLIPEWRNDLYQTKKELLKITGLSDITPTAIANWLEKNLDKKVLPYWPRTETDKLSVDAHTLADFQFVPIVKPFLEYQKKFIVTSTYGTALIRNVNRETGRIHTHYNLCGARTGRLSSRDPNLQNLPRDERIRSHFIAEEGKVLIVADYSQIEIRVGAELSRDEEMLKAYRQGMDIHSLTASSVSGKDISEITKADRQMAKAVNFGFMFGLGARKFSKYAKNSYGVDVTDEEAHEAIDTWRGLYSGYYTWQMAQAEKGAETKYTQTPMGKLRRLEATNTYGAAMNTPVQGGAAECMLGALIEVEKWCDDDCRLINCVHDEIILEVIDNPETIEETKIVLQSAMVDGFTRVFPEGITNNLSEVGEGGNWAEAKH